MKYFAGAVLSAVLLCASIAPAGALERVRAPQPKIGAEFPAFALPDVEGNEVSLEEFRGRTIILTFMSCYTDTCLASVGVVRKLTDEFGDAGLVAPMVCSEIPEALKKDKYAELQKRCGAGQVILVDEKKGLSSKYEIRTFPRTYLIGKDFKVRERIDGIPPLMRDDFSARVKALVNEEMTGAPPAAE